MTSTYYAIFIVTAVAAIIFFIAGVVMFFLFNIPKIVGFLTGYTARKQIKILQSKSVAGSVSQTAANDNLNAFMQQQRNIAAQVKNDETETVDLKTSNTVSQTEAIRNPNFQQKGTNPSVSQIPRNEAQSASDNTENIKKEFKFDIILSLDFINTDEVI